MEIELRQAGPDAGLRWDTVDGMRAIRAKIREEAL
jgi:hypothetical protein